MTIDKMSAIVLGAGMSTRMGQQKLLLPFGGSTLIESVINNVRIAGFRDVIAVLSREVATALPDLGSDIRIAINENPARGQFSSLAIGSSVLCEGTDFCIMLGDLPFVKSEEIERLAALFSELPRGKSALIPCRDGAFGHPMFCRALWRERFLGANSVVARSGEVQRRDVGGKNILKHWKDEIEETPASEIHFKDIDTLQDYCTVINSLHKTDRNSTKKTV